MWSPLIFLIALPRYTRHAVSCTRFKCTMRSALVTHAPHQSSVRSRGCTYLISQCLHGAPAPSPLPPNKAVMDISVQAFVWACACFSWEWNDCAVRVSVCLTIKQLLNCFSKWLFHFTFPPAVHKNYSSFTFLSLLGMVSFLKFYHFSRYEAVSHCAFNLPILRHNVEHFFVCVLVIHISLGKCLFKSLANFFKLGLLSYF